MASIAQKMAQLRALLTPSKSNPEWNIPQTAPPLVLSMLAPYLLDYLLDFLSRSDFLYYYYHVISLCVRCALGTENFLKILRA